MDKINFKDLPSEESPINSKNLNQMQDNIENGMCVAVYGAGDEKGVIDPNTTTKDLILTQHANVPDGGKEFYYIKTIFYGAISTDSNRSQIAIGYKVNQMYQRYYFNGAWSSWEKVNKGYVCDIIGFSLKEKGVKELSVNVSDYDEIRIWASSNAYDHRPMCNIYKYNLSSSFVHYIQYTPTDFDETLYIYDNKIDTTNCTNFGVNNRHIFRVEGIKYNA